MAEPFDARLEGLLRATLKAEAATLPVAIRPADVLRRRELRRRENARGRIRLLLIAAALALPLGAALVGALRSDPPPGGYSAVLVPIFGESNVEVFKARDGVAEHVHSLPTSQLDRAGIVGPASGRALEASPSGWVTMFAVTDLVQQSGHRDFLILMNLRDPDAPLIVREGTGLGAWTPDGRYWSATNSAYELIDPASRQVIRFQRSAAGTFDWYVEGDGRMRVAAEGNGLLLGGSEASAEAWAVLQPDGTLAAGLPEIADGVGRRGASREWGLLQPSPDGVVSGPAPDGTSRRWGPVTPLHHTVADASWAVDGGVWLLIDRRSAGRTMVVVHVDADNVEREVAAFPVEVDVQVSIGDLAPDDSLIGFNLVTSDPYGFRTVVVDTRSGVSHLFDGALVGFVATAHTVDWAASDRGAAAGQELVPPAAGGSSGPGYGPLLPVREQTAQLEADRILLVHEVAATSVDPGPTSQVTLGPVVLEEGFGISLVCSGPGEITVTAIARDGSQEAETYGCLTAGFPQGYEAPNVSRDALVQVSVEFDPSTAWRLIVYDPPPSIQRSQP